MTNKRLIEFMKSELAARSDADYSVKMAAYMKGHFVFAGVRGPQKQEVLKLLKAECQNWTIDQLVAVARDGWLDEWREVQQLCIDLLKWRRLRLTAQHLPHLEYMITHKSWWDSVDMIASNLIGTVLSHSKDLQYSTCERWIASENMWLRRSAIIHQLKYKEDTDHELLFALVESQKGSTEFFINKACGWALRQYAKTAPVHVAAFVSEHPDLSPLTIREARKSL